MSRASAVPVCTGVFAAASPVEPLRGRPALPADTRAARRVPVAGLPQHLAARALLRRLLAEVVSRDAAASPLAALAHGQPYLVDRPDVGVSLSHSGGWVAAAVNPGGTVGVDVQVPVPVSDRMVRRCCTPSARLALSRLPEPRRNLEFARIWSVQEACVKATGEGIAGLPWTVPVGLGQQAGQWRGLHWSRPRGGWPVPVGCAHPAAGDSPCLCAD